MNFAENNNLNIIQNKAEQKENKWINKIPLVFKINLSSVYHYYFFLHRKPLKNFNM